MYFTSEDAYEAQQDGEPIMISRARALAMLRSHGATAEEFDAEVAVRERYSAWDVLAWLGY
jgi:hypothetical protein